MNESPDFPATRQSALARLAAFLEHATGGHGYAATRNYVLPGHPNVSRLAPAIRHRLISEEEVVRLALARHEFSKIEKFIQEVLWRSYWKGWLELRPDVWSSYIEQVCQPSHHFDADTIARASHVASGQSPSPIMNAFARELLLTGYLHNHARMWWAGFWVHHCKLPWQLGAHHFFCHLLDADPASNTLSWRWVAGLQTPGKSYLTTPANIEKFCDPSLLSAAGGIGLETQTKPARQPDEHKSLPIQENIKYPTSPQNLLRPFAILVHDEDLSVENSPVGSVSNPSCLLHFEPDLSAEPVPRQRWLREARDDARQRAKAHFKIPATICKTPEDILKKTREAGCQFLVAIAPFVGPLRTSLNIENTNSPGFIWLRRRWDAKVIPLCSRGFFPFWFQAKKQLHQLIAS